MSLLLALLAQTAVPAPDSQPYSPADPAIACGATALGDPTKPDFESWERAMVFAMNAANGDPEGFQGRFRLAARAVALAAIEGKGLPLETCRTQFPAMWAKGPVPLPKGGFDRALFCTATASGLNTIAREMQLRYGVGPGNEWISPAMLRFAAQVDKLAPPAVKSWNQARIMAETSSQLMAASRLGMLSNAFSSCEAAFPPG